MREVEMKREEQAEKKDSDRDRQRAIGNEGRSEREKETEGVQGNVWVSGLRRKKNSYCRTEGQC